MAVDLQTSSLTSTSLSGMPDASGGSIDQLEQQVDQAISSAMRQSAPSFSAGSTAGVSTGTSASGTMPATTSDASLNLSANASLGDDSSMSSLEQEIDQLEQELDQEIEQAEQSMGSSTPDSTPSTGMNAQSASGALSSYMSQNGIGSLDPNQLYQLAMNPPAGTPSDVSSAASFMLQNPGTFKQIETHDVPGADGIAGVNDFQWAAEGGLGDTTSDASSGDIESGDPMTAQSASGALSSYMSQNGIGSLNPNQLYQLAENPPAGTPSDVSSAASYMLQNPDMFQQLETHDVAGTDGIAGLGDFQWAAEGGLDSSSGSGSSGLGLGLSGSAQA